VVFALDGGPLIGPVSWRKPITFGLSFGIVLATITWLASMLRMPPRSRVGLLGVFAAASVLEVVVITTQAWRHVPSHFNISTPVDSAFATASAIGGGMLLVSSAGVAAVAVGRAQPQLSASMKLAVRIGFLTFLVALAIGAVMIAKGVSQARAGHQDLAYTIAAGLKPAHGVAMYGILVLPALAWLLGRTPWPDSARRRIVALGCLGYVVATAVTVYDGFAGVNPLTVLSSVLAAVGLALIVAAGVAAVLGVLRARHRPSTGIGGTLVSAGHRRRRS
jgi:hypothetical protein